MKNKQSVEIVTINLPDDEDEALDFLLSHKDCQKVRITGKMKTWYWDINDWINANEITYLDLYGCTGMTEWGDGYEYLGSPSGGIYNCETLEEVILPQNLEGLGVDYFAGCSGIHSIYIPASIRYMSELPGIPPLGGTSLRTIKLELSNNNSWIIPVFSHLDIECIIEDDNFLETKGVVYNIKKGELMRFPRDFDGDFSFPSDIRIIGDYAFRGVRLKELHVPSIIEEIGKGAFCEADIDTVIFEEGIEAITGGKATEQDASYGYFSGSVFTKSHIHRIVLPSTLKEFGYQPFSGCLKLENVSFRKENPFFEIVNDVFYQKKNKSVVGFIPNKENKYVVQPGTLTIGEHAFSMRGIPMWDTKWANEMQIFLPESLESIEAYAFFACRIKEINFHDNLMKIGEYAFALSNLECVKIPDTVMSIAEGAFNGCQAMKEIRLPEALDHLENYTFCNCQSLISVRIPVSVTEIGSGCFEECKSLTEIILPDGLKKLLPQAFNGCISLQAISLPESLESIDDGVFYNCTSLKEVLIPDGVNQLGSLAFFGCINLTTVNIPAECELYSPNNYFYQFEGCASIRKFSVSEKSPYYSFSEGILYNKEGNFLIRSFSTEQIIHILEGVFTIGPKAFSHSICEEIIIPDSVTELGSMAFFNCTNLKEIRFSRNITKITTEHFWTEDSTGETEGPFGWMFDKCPNLSKISNVSIDTLQKFPEVFKNIAGATVSVEKEALPAKDKVSYADNLQDIPEEVLASITPEYFFDPDQVLQKIQEIIKYRDDNLLERGTPYLNQVRKLLEYVRNSLQKTGVIPQRCLAFTTSYKILTYRWPEEVVPVAIRSKIMKVWDLCNKGSHAEKDTQTIFNAEKFTNKDIIEFCLLMIRFVRHVHDFLKANGYNRRTFENVFHSSIYGYFRSDETSNSTVGYIQSYQRFDRKTNTYKRNIEVVHRDKSWQKIRLYQDALLDYYLRTKHEVEEDHKVRVEFIEKHDNYNNPYWEVTNIIEIIKPARLLNNDVLS